MGTFKQEIKPVVSRTISSNLEKNVKVMAVFSHSRAITLSTQKTSKQKRRFLGDTLLYNERIVL